MTHASRGTVASICGLLAVGALSLTVSIIPGVTAVREARLVGIVMGETVLSLSTFVINAGLFLIGLAAILFGILLATARVG